VHHRRRRGSPHPAPWDRSLPANAPQEPLDHEDVLQWKAIDNPSLSPDGDWLAFVLTPLEGDWAVRMQQFFDHYLVGRARPRVDGERGASGR
jgi:hypothetical protein